MEHSTAFPYGALSPLANQSANGLTLTTFRVLQSPPKSLDPLLRPGAPALLILSNGPSEGRIVSFESAEEGYRVTIESVAATVL